jgi:cell division protein FtsZ
MVFIACGMGGGTGTGAAPVIASVAKNEGILTVAVVTKPFFFEGASRMKLAERGLEELEKEVDALIVIPNDRLLSIIDKNTSVKQAFEMCDEVLKQAVEGISDIIRTAGTINLDFADIKRILKDSGTALMGVGRGVGENRAREAAVAAVNSPLLDVSIHGAKGVLFAIYGAEDLGMLEVQEAAKIITESVDKDAKIIFGIAIDSSLKKDEIKVTVIATGFPTTFSSRTTAHALERKDTPAIIKPEPRVEKNETVRQAINEEKRIDHVVEDAKVVEDDDTKKNTSKKTTFKFEDDDDDDWEALPPFLRRKK